MNCHAHIFAAALLALAPTLASAGDTPTSSSGTKLPENFRAASFSVG